MKLNYKIFFTTIIICLLILVRFYNLGKVPLSLYWDEYAIGIDAYAVAHTGRDLHDNFFIQPIYRSYGDFKAPVAIIITSLFVKILGLSEFSLRLPFALMMLLGIWGLWLLVRILLKQDHNIQSKITNNIYILLSIFLLTTPWLYHFGRISFESGMSLTIVIWSLYFLIKGLFHTNKKFSVFYIIFASLLASLSVYTYFSARYIMPIFIGMVLLVFYKQAWQKKWLILLAVVIFLSAQMPILHSPIYAESQRLRLSAPSILKADQYVAQSAQLILDNNNSLLSRIIYHRYWFIIRAFAKNYLSHFSLSFLWLNGDANLRHHTGWGGQLLFVTLPIFLLGVYFMLKNIHKPIVLIVLGWLLIAPITASVPYEVPHASRAIYMIIPLTLIFVFSIVQGYVLVNKFNLLKKIFLSFLIIFLIVNFIFYIEDYFSHYPIRSAYDWQLGNKYMGEISKQEKNNYQKIILSEVYRLPYLAVFFYNPEYILDIQKQIIAKGTHQDYFWMYQYGKYQYGDVNPKDLNKDTLYLGKPDNKIKDFVNQIYVYPNGKEVLYRF